MPPILERLRNGLIVSCQPVPGGPLDTREAVVGFALASLDGGAVGLRIEGVENVAAVRKATQAPIIGLVKQDRSDSPVRITPRVRDVLALAKAGADIIAFDATDRARPEPVAQLFSAIKAEKKWAMADCASLEEAETAHHIGCEIVGSTLSGYTGGPVPEGPDLELVTRLSSLGAFVIAEGRYHAPHQASQALRAGADAVVVGSAITRPEHVTSWFVEALLQSAPSKASP